MSGLEQQYVQSAFDSNWIAPLGPNVDAFEQDICDLTGAKHALALSSGTAALHLALIHLGIGRGDEVVVSTFTFSASVNPILYQGAVPIFIDSERASWNMDANLLADFLAKRARQNRLPKAVVLVHLYGQSADVDAILSICNQYAIPLIEDAAEALGATYKSKSPGTFGAMGFYSFNGNKIITTSGGGMLVSDDGEAIAHARKLSTQARDDAPHYQHSEIGYNYRLSNILAGVGRGQLQVLEDRVQALRRNFTYYEETLSHLSGISFMPEATWGQHTRWLTTLTIDADAFGADTTAVQQVFAANNIEARPLWKPMHMQPIFEQYESIGGDVSANLFKDGICLPSGSDLTMEELERVTAVFKSSSHR